MFFLFLDTDPNKGKHAKHLGYRSNTINDIFLVLAMIILYDDDDDDNDHDNGDVII